MTYRHSGHSRATRPSTGPRASWSTGRRPRTPIKIYRERLAQFGISEAQMKQIDDEVLKVVDEATEAARPAPTTSTDILFTDVYADGGWAWAELSYREAVIRGISQEMERDEDVVFLGEDIAKAGGVFKATLGLYDQFGPLRVRDTPISEQAILGAAMGAAMTGLKPIAEIMFADFLAVCYDYIANELPKAHYMTNGR